MEHHAGLEQCLVSRLQVEKDALAPVRREVEAHRVAGALGHAPAELPRDPHRRVVDRSRSDPGTDRVDRRVQHLAHDARALAKRLVGRAQVVGAEDGRGVAPDDAGHLQEHGFSGRYRLAAPHRMGNHRPVSGRHEHRQPGILASVADHGLVHPCRELVLRTGPASQAFRRDAGRDRGNPARLPNVCELAPGLDRPLRFHEARRVDDGGFVHQRGQLPVIPHRVEPGPEVHADPSLRDPEVMQGPRDAAHRRFVVLEGAKVRRIEPRVCVQVAALEPSDDDGRIAVVRDHQGLGKIVAGGLEPGQVADVLGAGDQERVDLQGGHSRSGRFQPRPVLLDGKGRIPLYLHPQPHLGEREAPGLTLRLRARLPEQRCPDPELGPPAGIGTGHASRQKRTSCPATACEGSPCTAGAAPGRGSLED